MNALAYSLRKQCKNLLLNLKNHPSQAVLAIVLVALMLFSLLGPQSAPVPETGYRDTAELGAGVFLLYMIFFILMANNGFGSGASMYSMADVNLLFETPIRPTTILSYGLIRQMGTSLLACIFIIFQYSWLHNLYGISIGFVVVVLLCFAAVIMCGQMTAMLIYSKTSADDRVKRIWRAVFYAVFLLFFAVCAYFILQRREEGFFNAAVGVFNTAAAAFFPAAGWMKAAAIGVMEGEWLPVLLGIGGTVGFMAAVVFLIARSNTDYYEDVLAATEVAHSAIVARKQGGMNEPVPKNVKVGKIGIGKGRGASAVYYKQLVERRRGGLFLIDRMSLIFIAITIVTSVIIGMGMDMEGETADGAEASSPAVVSVAGEAVALPEGAEESLDLNPAVISALAMSVYMQMFSSTMGRFAKELRLPYLYMIPESPFKKLLYCIRESASTLIAEGVLLWVPLYFLLKMDLPTAVCCVISRVFFGYLFIVANIFIERFMSSMPKVFSTIFYFLFAVLLLIPGAVGGIAAGAALSAVAGLPLMATALIAVSLVNAAVSLLFLYISRNMLVYADLNG